MPKLRTNAKEGGFSLIEVLIALLILAIGLLGTASLMLISMKSNQSAYQRSQASWLAYDIVERMRLNRGLATDNSNSYVITAATPLPSDPGCKAGGCTAANVASLDIREWRDQLGLAGVSGTVARNGAAYTVTISWQEDSSPACAVVDGTPQCSFVLRADL
jgi:type IV pilus assembly protein PilV